MSALDHTRRYILKPSRLEDVQQDEKQAKDPTRRCGNCCGKNTTKRSC